MKRTARSFLPFISAAFGSLALVANPVFAQGTAFVYQGELRTNGVPATGSFDFQFYLRDAATAGSPVGTTNTLPAVVVSDGLFSVVLDFGGAPFSAGAARWLEISVRAGGAAGAYTGLSPRSPLLASPYAITAGNLTGPLPATQLSGSLPSSQLSGTYSGLLSFNNPANTFVGSGAGLTGVWKSTGNSGTSGEANFLGTTDNQALTFRVNNAVALQIQPGVTLPNLVGGMGGYLPSVIGAGVSGGVIAGGNAPSGGVSGFGGGDFHAVYDNDGTIGGGFGNKAGNANTDVTDAAFATVAGGVFNLAAGYASAVLGGDGNAVWGQRASIAGGYGNQSMAAFSFIGSGFQNSIQTNAQNSLIAGGSNNIIKASVVSSTIGGGAQNTIDLGTFGTVGATIGGGIGNTVLTQDPRYVTIAGGYGNTVSEVGSTVGGGYGNSSTGAESTVAGGYQNVASVQQSTVGGGFGNTSSGFLATVSGGGNNLASGDRANIGGGTLNKSTNFHSVVSGGAGNTSGGYTTTVGGGYYNTSTGNYSTVPGGNLNVAAGNSSFAAGQRAKANHPGSFVWADSQFADFDSTADNQVSFRCLGGVRFSSGGAMVNQVSWIPGAGSWSFVSDRNLKESFEPVDTRAVLEKVVQLPITEWNYKGYPQRHIGAMAQDFHKAFPLNESTTSLNDADLHGVALAAIQGLNRLQEEKNARIHALEERLAELEKRMQSMSAGK